MQRHGMALALLIVTGASPASADFLIARGFEPGRGYVCEHAPHCVDPGCQDGEICRRGGEGDSLQGCFRPTDHPCCISHEDCPPLPELGEIVEVRCLGAVDGPPFFGVCQYVRPGEDPERCALTLEYAPLPCFGAEAWADGDCDGDGVPNGDDVCLCAPDPDQRDCDGDGVGAACTAPPRPDIAPLAELCPEAASYEETRCQGRWCGCRGILAEDDPWCADPACLALPSMADAVEDCALVDAGVDAGFDAGADAGVDAGVRDGGAQGVPTGGGCAAGGGGRVGLLWLAALVSCGIFRKRRFP